MTLTIIARACGDIIALSCVQIFHAIIDAGSTMVAQNMGLLVVLTGDERAIASNLFSIFAVI